MRIKTKLISLPIPESKKIFPDCKRVVNHLRYADLPEHEQIGSFVNHLADISSNRLVHLDPDIRPELRLSDISCDALLFGQTGAAQKHLENQGVGPESLFLFFGWFQHAECVRGEWNRKGPDEHIIWGWLQVEESFPITNRKQAAELAWAKHHPHVAHWRKFGANNRLYKARKYLSFLPKLPGAGVFDWRVPLTLTERCSTGVSRRNWCVPSVFASTGLTYNRVDGACSSLRKRVHLRSACIGQEFVLPAGNRDFTIEEHKEIALWLQEIFSGLSK